MTYAYNPDGMWTGTHQMTINGKRDKITGPDLLASARNMGVKNAEAKRIISEVRESLKKWPDYAEKAGLREAAVEKIQKTFLTALSS